MRGSLHALGPPTVNRGGKNTISLVQGRLRSHSNTSTNLWVIPFSTLRINLGLMRLRLSELLVVVDDEEDCGPLRGFGLTALIEEDAEVEAVIVEELVDLAVVESC
mmetsp:Transcript_27677/g.38088  ORF Transcript_27677/g.38088 Transcript_27677/m.38088 type:complete len:106 (-) Transcript_27677:325-642(-)